MVIPLLLIVLAAVAAAAVAYGTHPGWMELQHGLQVIVWSRRLQWPLVSLSIVACVVLLGLIVLGRRRAWWVLGLAPVLALFVHKFHTERARAPAVLDDPPFAAADSADFLADDDWVVGLRFGDTAYAYPYAGLYRAPVVLQSDHDHHLALFWSAGANRAQAFRATAGLKARDLEVTSTPASAPLVYNRRRGQFVNGLTGRLIDGSKPYGLGAPIPTAKTTWKRWRDANPMGKVMRVATATPGPAGPVLAAHSGRPSKGGSAPAGGTARHTPGRAVVVGTTQPAVVDAAALTRRPLNLRADGEPVLVFRPADGEPARAFGRRFGDDIRSRFEAAKPDPRHPTALFKDVDTGTLWDADGVAVGGNRQFVGKRLTPVPVDDNVDWAVLKFWCPELELHQEAVTPDAPQPATRPAGPTTKPSRTTTRPSNRSARPPRR